MSISPAATEAAEAAAATEATTEEKTTEADGTSIGTSWQRFTRWLRKWRFWLIVSAIFLLVLAISLAGALGSASKSAARLSPINAAPAGAMAAAEVLKQQGIKVQPSDNLESTLQAVAAQGASSSTVLLYDPKLLLSSEQLSKLKQSGARIVVISPGPLALQALSSEITSAGFYSVGSDHQGDEVAAKCSNQDALAAGKIDGEQAALYSGPTVCFSTDDSPSEKSEPSKNTEKTGQFAQSADQQLTVIGNADIFSNARLAHSGNAALVFRLLGHNQQLVWYLPSAKDLPVSAERPSLNSLQPAWLVPVSVWLVIVAILAMFWKGRRDGPLVEEPLPVIVKASETATGRARLYQDGRALDRASASLRAATLQRLARKLRLGPAASRESIVLAVIAHSSLPEPEIRRILLLTEPGNDSQFLAWSQDLAAVEKDLEKEY
ncbi:DUF4350 domain-containing protein [Psychromicrobium lacuslunae]|uniref:DUF4350 domain-containing protein n=1 Tax=Psychromicrobium lacuslunae TaxID=1618207 RepID=UPI0005D326BE|nr:DUF4350 domain-containing protein [Psychromicrobium lacuslunae]